MTSNVKILGLVIGAALALAGVFTSSASAQFEAESAPMKITRSANTTQVYTYSPEGVSISCANFEGEGTITSTPTTELTFVPVYSSCISSLGGPVEVKFNGCQYRYTSAKGSTNITVHIECPAGKKIEIGVRASGVLVCTLLIAPQTPGGTITGSNVGTGTTREVRKTSSDTGIVAERLGSALCGPATSTSGTYTGEVTFTGENPTTNEHIGFFMD